MRRTLLIF